MNTFKQDTKTANSRSPYEVMALLRRHIWGIVRVVRRRTFQQDLKGTDYIAYLRDGTVLRVDLKDLNYIPPSRDGDRVLLETKILGRTEKEGWATDETKETDVFLIIRGDDSSVFLWATTLRRLIKKRRSIWRKTGISREGRNLTRGNHEIFACEFITVPVSILEIDCLKRVS